MHNCNQIERKEASNRDANLPWFRFSLLALVVLILFKNDEACPNTDLR
jgi:hypothetical protein